jgi:hypothetical protein
MVGLVFIYRHRHVKNALGMSMPEYLPPTLNNVVLYATKCPVLSSKFIEHEIEQRVLLQNPDTPLNSLI